MSGDSDNLGIARAAGDAGAALVVTGLACRRGDRTLFADLAFSACGGDIVWLRGANGQGKTTLLRTLAGLSAPAAGRIERRGAAVGWNVLHIGHANGLKDDLSVAESLAFLLRLGGAAAVPLAWHMQALGRFGVAGRAAAPVRTLSQGQRRRVALARLAALDEPALCLLDEPYDALDAAGAATLDAVLAEQAERGGIVVLTSHVPLAIAALRPLVVDLDALAAPAALAAAAVAG